MKTGLRPNEVGAMRLMKTFAPLTNEAKSPACLISSEGASSLAKRLHFFISTPAGGAVARSDSPPDCHSPRALRIPSNQQTSTPSRGACLLAEKVGFARLRAERWRALTVPRTVIHYAPFESPQINKQAPREGVLVCWRRRWDSNPRGAINAYTISSRAPSTS